MEFVVMTISDSCSEGSRKDASGPLLQRALQGSFPRARVRCEGLPDEAEVIRERLRDLSDYGVSLVITCGGTGLGPRDVTPEATTAVIERPTQGLSEAVRLAGLRHTPLAALSRAVSGVCGSTLIINLPGSPKAARESYEALEPLLPHALRQLRGPLKDTHAAEDEIHGGPHQQKAAAVHTVFTTKGLFDIKVRDNEELHGCGCEHAEGPAHRERESIYPMVEMSIARRLIKESFVKYFPVEESVPLSEALINGAGRVTLRDVAASEPFPPFAASVKDGYACLSSDGAGHRQVRGAICAGDSPGAPLTPGLCERISTGAPVPPGADCVVQVEDTELIQSDGGEELVIQVLEAPTPGQDIRPIGSDIAQGQIVVASGASLGAAEMALLAAVAPTELCLSRCPRVALLSTGSELQPPTSAPLRPGLIRDSNTVMLRTLLRDELNIECADMGIAPDTEDALQSALEAAFSRCDVLVTSGGVSMGERDLLKPVLSRLGAQIVFGRLNMKPGKPTVFATCLYHGEMKFVFALPGNPVSAFVTAHLLLLPALRAAAGASACEPARLRVRLGRPVCLDSRPEYARALYQYRQGDIPVATPTGSQMSSRLLSAAGAPLLLELPGARVGAKELPEGAEITALVVGRLRTTFEEI